MSQDNNKAASAAGFLREMAKASVGACNCGARTPLHQNHDYACRYRVIEEARAALAERAQAAQPSVAEWPDMVPLSKDGTHIWLDGIGAVELLYPATPATEQEAAQVAPPGAQEAAAWIQPSVLATVRAGGCGIVGDSKNEHRTIALYTAPVPATTPAEPIDTDTRPAFNPYDAGQTRDPSKLKGGPKTDKGGA